METVDKNFVDENKHWRRVTFLIKIHWFLINLISIKLVTRLNSLK